MVDFFLKSETVLTLVNMYIVVVWSECFPHGAEVLVKAFLLFLVVMNKHCWRQLRDGQFTYNYKDLLYKDTMTFGIFNFKEVFSCNIFLGNC